MPKGFAENGQHKGKRVVSGNSTIKHMTSKLPTRKAVPCISMKPH